MAYNVDRNLVNKIIFKKYKIKRLMCESSFSQVYEGINIKQKTPVVLKIEHKTKFNLLESEAYLLLYLKGVGIPEVVSYGRYGPYKILIEELLGPTIECLWDKYIIEQGSKIKNNVLLKNLCLFALQCLERFEFIHNKNVVHRDIKPKNFIIGRKDPNVIYLIDFGFARKYKSSRTGKHIRFQNIKIMIGSIYYGSRYVMKGYEGSRRDDLESFGYMLICLANRGWLPWKKFCENTEEDQMEKLDKIDNMKMTIADEELCYGLPSEFVSYMKYVKSLEFEQDPDYNYIKGLFISILSKSDVPRNINFFWINNNKTKKIRDNTTDNASFNAKKLLVYGLKKKSRSLNRLYYHIKNSLKYKSQAEFPITNNNKIINNIISQDVSEHHNNDMPKLNIESFLPKKITINLEKNTIEKTPNLNKPNKTTNPEKNRVINKYTKYNLLKKTEDKNSRINRTELRKDVINNNRVDTYKTLKDDYKTLYQKHRVNSGTKNIILYNHINYNSLYLIKNNNNDSLLKRKNLIKNYTNQNDKKIIFNKVKTMKNYIYRPLFTYGGKIQKYPKTEFNTNN